MTAYLGPVTSVDHLPAANATPHGYKAVILTRRRSPNGDKHDSRRIVSKTVPTRDEALAIAARSIAAKCGDSPAA